MSSREREKVLLINAREDANEVGKVTRKMSIVLHKATRKRDFTEISDSAKLLYFIIFALPLQRNRVPSIEYSTPFRKLGS